MKVDVRVLAATNCDLRKLVRNKQFREDLYYRINVVSIHMPPLRERREDIPLLAEHFLAAQCSRYGEPIRRFSQEAMRKLCGYRWPGNVREVINLVERAFVLSHGAVIEAEHVQISDHDGGRPTGDGLPSLEEAERDLIAQALRIARGCKNEAARMLKIERRRLYRKVSRLGLEALCQRSA